MTAPLPLVAEEYGARARVTFGVDVTIDGDRLRDLSQEEVGAAVVDAFLDKVASTSVRRRIWRALREDPPSLKGMGPPPPRRAPALEVKGYVDVGRGPRGACVDVGIEGDRRRDLSQEQLVDAVVTALTSASICSWIRAALALEVVGSVYVGYYRWLGDPLGDRIDLMIDGELVPALVIRDAPREDAPATTRGGST